MCSFNVRLYTTSDVAKISHYATSSQDEWFVVNGKYRQCIDARSILGVMYALAKFKNPYMYSPTAQEIPPELVQLLLD